eukprot:227877-Amphidinium_carterae.1
MIQWSYIKHHPTSGYKTATKEIQRVYDGFEIYNYMDKTNPRKPLEDDDNTSMGLQQLLGISLHRTSSRPSNYSNLTAYDIKDGKKSKYDNMN